MTLTTAMLTSTIGDLAATEIQTVTSAKAKDIKALTGLTATIISSDITAANHGFVLLPEAALKGLTTTQTAALPAATINAMLNPDALDFSALTAANLNLLEVATLEKAKNNLAEITTTQAASTDLTTTTFGQLSTTAVQKLKPEVVEALTATHGLTIDKFSNKQLSGLTTTAPFTVNSLPAEKFKYLSPTLIGSPNPLAEADAPYGFVQHMSKAQLSVLPDGSLLTTDHLEALPASDFPHLSATYLTSHLTTTSVSKLDKATVAKMPLAPLTAPVLNAFTTEQISALKPSEFKKLDPTLEGPAGPTGATKQLSKDFLEALTVTQQQAMPADIINNFVSGDFAGTNGGNGGCAAVDDGLTTTWVSQLAPVQIEALIIAGESAPAISGCAFGSLGT